MGRRPGEGATDRLIPARDRLMSRIRVRDDGCWEWTGFITARGYGACGYRGKRNVLAHRAVYTEFVGPIADDLTLDHQCHNRDQSCPGGNTCPHRRCVNPEHVEPVPGAVNSSRSVFARRTHCPKGHPYDGDNLALTCNGGRFCRTCSQERARKRHQENMVKKRAARPADWKPKPRRRPTHCKRGHPFDAENTYVTPEGRHHCRECARARREMSRQHPSQMGNPT